MSFCFGWFADNLLPKLRKSRKICNRVKTKKDVESSTSFCFVLLRKERDYCTWFVILVARRGAPAKFTPQKLINHLPFVSRHYACEKICPHNAVKQKKDVESSTSFCFVLLRKERDSNPRNLSVQRFSRPPQSTTLPSFRRKSRNYFPFCQIFASF